MGRTNPTHGTTQKHVEHHDATDVKNQLLENIRNNRKLEAKTN